MIRATWRGCVVGAEDEPVGKIEVAAGAPGGASQECGSTIRGGLSRRDGRVMSPDPARPPAGRSRRWVKGLWALGAGGLGLLGLGVIVGLWGSRGHLPAFIDGQLSPGPILRATHVSAHPPRDAVPYAVAVTVDDANSVIREVSARYLSFAIDTSAVVGGKWWDPEASGPEMGSGTVNAPVFDFDRPRLDVLTRALAPAYLRIGGSEADKVFYDMTGAPDREPRVPPGYESVLTRAQWDAVQAFARRNGLDVVMTVNAGPASRDAQGDWRSENAEALLAYSRRQGYRIAEWEFGNELNLFWFVHGLAEQVPVRRYVDELRRLRTLVARYYPESRVSGQSAAFWPVLGEPLRLIFGFQTAYARAVGTDTDTFGWHYYPQQSRRGPIASRRATPARMLDPRNLDEVGHWAAHNAALRDAHCPRCPLWLGETGNAQFGGEPGLSDRYLASLWWMDQLGLLAVHEHDVVVRQTLAGSNYQLITADTLDPLPDYWASLLWKKLMGTGVLSARVEGSKRVRAYAHRTPDGRGVTVLVVNLDPERVVQVSGLDRPGVAEVYAVTSGDLFGTEVLLNGRPLAMTGDTLPELAGAPRPSAADVLAVNPLSYTFVTFRPEPPRPALER